MLFLTATPLQSPSSPKHRASFANKSGYSNPKRLFKHLRCLIHLSKDPQKTLTRHILTSARELQRRFFSRRKKCRAKPRIEFRAPHKRIERLNLNILKKKNHGKDVNCRERERDCLQEKDRREKDIGRAQVPFRKYHKLSSDVA